MSLDELRTHLDVIDEQVLALLSRRAQVVAQVAAYKRQHAIPIHLPERETWIIERLQAKNPGPLSNEALERIFRTIIEEMRKFEATV